MSDEKSYNLLNRKESAEFLSMSLSSFDKARKLRGFPAPFIMLDTSKWFESDLIEFLEASKAE